MGSSSSKESESARRRRHDSYLAELLEEYESATARLAAITAGAESSSECASDCECSACESDGSLEEHDWKYRQDPSSQSAHGQPAYESHYVDPLAYSSRASGSFHPQSSSNNYNNNNNNNSFIVWQVSPDGPILDISFTPGGEHVVAVVKTSRSLGAQQEFRIWEVRSSRPVHVQNQSQQGNSGMGSEVYGNSFQDSTPDSHTINGSFIMSPCWKESFLRPDDRFFSPKLDFVDICSRDIVSFEIPSKMLSLPMVASPSPGSIMGFDQILVGVDSVCKSIIHVVGSAKNGARIEKSHDLRCGEITHLAFFPTGQHVLSLSKSGVCRCTNIEDGSGDGIHIKSNHAADMLQYVHRRHVDHDSVSEYSAYEHVVSVFGSDVAIWYWWPHRDEGPTNRLLMYNLNTTLGRCVTPLCITYDGVFLACASDDGFDIIEVVTGKWVMGTSSWRGGPFGICKGAFSPDGSEIILCTQERTIYSHNLDGLY